MQKRIMSIVVVVCLVISMFSVTAFAGNSGPQTSNGICLTASASGSFAQNQVDATAATTTCAVLSVYSTAGKRVDYDIQYSNYGPTQAIAWSTVTNGYYILASSSATISGSAVPGPTNIKVYY